jgi:hypothetical protein
MRTRRSAALLAAALATTTTTIALSGVSLANPEFLPTSSAFSGTPVSQLGITTAMAGDGTVVVGRVFPLTDGAVEVQVRPPGGALGAVTPLQTATAGVNPTGLVLYGAPNGALAAVWSDGTDQVMSLLPAGATSWTSAVPLAGGVFDPATAMDPDGRLWVGVQTGSGPFTNTFQIFTPSGSLDSTVAFPTPPAGTFQGEPSLAIGPDGVGHVVFRRSTAGTGAEGDPCTNTLVIEAGDVVRGTTSATASPLETVTSTGTISGGSCSAGLSGSSLSAPLVEVAADGVATAVFEVNQVVAPFHSVIHAYRKPPGGSWSSVAEPVIATPDNYIVTDLVAVGATPVAVVQHSTVTDIEQGIVVRQPGGSWSGLQLLTGPGQGGSVAAAGSPQGGAVFAWHELDSPFQMQFRTLDASGALSAIHNVASTNTGRMTAAGADVQGNAVVTFTAAGSPFTGQVVPFDGAGPRLTARTIPGKAAPGQPIQLSVTPVDVWSPPASTPAWSFDDGTSATGTSVSHTFTTPGAHTVTVSSTDALGNTSSASSVVTVSATDTHGPTLTRKPKVKPRTPVHTKRARLMIGVDEPCAMTVTLKRRGGGTKSFTATLGAGKQTLKLPRLGAGRWTAKLHLTDVAGNSTNASVRFTVA